MKKSFLSTIIVSTIFSGVSAVRAETLAYSFESVPAPGPDGFFGLGVTTSQEPVIGVTHLNNSLKVEAGNGGFVGTRTELVIPPELNDPPGVTHVLFDLTVTGRYAGTFADLGVTVFGHALNAPGGAEFGHQVQFIDTLSISTLFLAPGTYLDRQINLDVAAGPYRPGESFNAIFGPGPTDLTVASAFQFFVSKDAGVPLTFYIDNVRLVNAVPEPAAGWFLGSGAVAACFAAGWRRRKQDSSRTA